MHNLRFLARCWAKRPLGGGGGRSRAWIRAVGASNGHAFPFWEVDQTWAAEARSCVPLSHRVFCWLFCDSTGCMLGDFFGILTVLSNACAISTRIWACARSIQPSWGAKSGHIRAMVVSGKFELEAQRSSICVALSMQRRTSRVGPLEAKAISTAGTLFYAADLTLGNTLTCCF